MTVQTGIYRWWVGVMHSVAFRLTLYACLMAVVMSSVLLALFYAQTASILEAQFTKQVMVTAQRLMAHYAQSGRDALVNEIALELKDEVNAETEILAVFNAQGGMLAGNSNEWPFADNDVGSDIALHKINLRGQTVNAYAVVRQLPDGSRLLVGQDARDLQHVTKQLNRLLILAGVLIPILTCFGGFLFRRALQQRVEVIRKTAARVSDGLLSERVPESRSQDEFALLTHDINYMLDRIERLMTGARDVSDAVAHNLRTPIARIMLSLRPALRADSTEPELRKVAEFTAFQLEELSKILEKLLQIAELESGVRRTAFSKVDLALVVQDVVDLYSAFAEESGALITLQTTGNTVVDGDRDLLASAVANLIDNALKYAGKGAVIKVTLVGLSTRVILTVADNGPGIPPDKCDRIGQRFYRMGRKDAGYGLGLASVIAITKLHDGQFRIEPSPCGAVIALDLPKSDTT